MRLNHIVCKILIIALVLGLSSLEKMSDSYLIDDIFTNVTVFNDESLQMRIKWIDKIKGDWYYNIIVTPDNFTGCSKIPCGIYGIRKPQDEVVLPLNPISYIEHNTECNILPGCNYTVTVETTNAAISKTKQVQIPYCVGEVCSCRHANKIPKINMFAKIQSNNTISIRWKVLLKGFQMDHQKFDQISFNLSAIYITISQQTNPSLTWGGPSKVMIRRLHPISLTDEVISNGFIDGEMVLELPENLSSKFLYFLRIYVVDEIHCSGPESHLRIRVPSVDKEHFNDDMDVKHAGVIIVPLFFLCIAVIIFIIIFHVRSRCRGASQSVQDKMFIPQATNLKWLTSGNRNLNEQVLQQPDSFEIPHSALVLGAEIGEGAFGRVYKAILSKLLTLSNATESIVAVKRLKENPTSDEIEEFLKEIAMLKSVGMHTNIVSFLGCCTIRQPYMIVMEFVGRGDLLDYLRTSRKSFAGRKSRSEDSVFQRNYANAITANVNQVKYTQLKYSSNTSLPLDEDKYLRPSVTETMYTELSCSAHEQEENGSSFSFEYLVDNNELDNFALQIANGMRYLEERQITHRDLAARNVLIDERKTLKISDFGLSRYGIYSNTKNRKLPLRWLSIEGILDNLYSNKSDVWAFGIVLWEIGTLGASPYPTISNSELIPFLLDGKRLEKPEICTDEAYELMLDCWNHDPDDRPTFNEIYNKLKPKTVYVDVNSLSEDYIFPPIEDK